MVLKDIKYATRLSRAGFKHPLITVQEAKRAGLQLAAACAMLEKESGKGENVFGHDPVANPIKGGLVTKDRYLAYKKYRKQGLGMQGVGPTQLTYYTLQDQADALGGCWKPRFNMRVGFATLQASIKAYGFQQGAAHYNGVGPAAQAYGLDFEGKRLHWHTYLNA